MIKRKLLVLMLMAISVLLVGCGASTAVFRGDISHTGQMSSSGPTTLDTLVWK